MDEKSHWNRIAPIYNEEIFDVFRSDRKRKLPRYFNKHAGLTKTAIDFGCGNGKSFPYLAPRFMRILGLDISKGLLQQAAQRGYSNVVVKQQDLTKKTLRLPQADFAFCCNVIMFPVIEKNRIMLRNINNALKSGGAALMVLPSLESALFSSWRLIDLYRREGVKPRDIPSHEFHYFKGHKRDILQGIVHIDGVPTKHYLEPELQVIFQEAGFTITKVDKLEYDWNTELSTPPKWMHDPYPWDWLVECRK
jgi:SAM-dependent methyltransferase